MASSQESSFFHSSAWARVIHESYGYTPNYFAVINEGELLFLLPAMEVKRFFGGKKGVSLPFSDYCEPIIEQSLNMDDQFDMIVQYGKKVGWKSYEMRMGKNRLAGRKASEKYYEHTLILRDSEEKIFSGFRRDIKYRIRKAVRDGITFEISTDLNALKDFYALNCMTRKRHGLPPQPFSFFQNVFDYVISKGMGFIAVASHESKVIGASVFFHFNKSAVYKYSATDWHFRNNGATHFLLWEVIKSLKLTGIKELSFGRTALSNEGLQLFKIGWGTVESTLFYYRYHLGKDEMVLESKNGIPFYQRIFDRTPIPVLKVIGQVAYKYMG